MKQITKSILTLLCSIVALISCDKSEAEQPILTADMASIEVVANNPDDVSVALTSNTTWIVLAPNWITPSATYGSGNAILTFKFEPNYKDELTSKPVRHGEIKISGGGTLNGKGAVITIPVTQLGYTYVDPTPSIGGIDSATELIKFTKAVSEGTSLKRWTNDNGDVVLLADIDLTGITEWTPAGAVSATGQPKFEGTSFSGVFDGQGHKITGINWTFNLTESPIHAFGLFGSLNNATVKNLVLGSENGNDKITLVGSIDKVISTGALVGYAQNSTITGITNYVDVALAGKGAAVPGDNLNNVLMTLGGVVGSAMSPMSIGSQAGPIKNYGDVSTGKISNEKNGGTGMTVGGVAAFTVSVSNAELKMDYCFNYGTISAPTGRGGGLVGTMGGVNSKDATAKSIISNSENYGLVQDDVDGLMYGGATNKAGNKRMGGLVGGTVDNSTGMLIENCINKGNVFSQVGCRVGGFVGHNNVTIKGCKNEGVILGDITTTEKDGQTIPNHAPGWACGYNGKKEYIISCTMGGKVGSWTEYKDNPSAAPAATADNAIGYNNASAFDPSTNN